MKLPGKVASGSGRSQRMCTAVSVNLVRVGAFALAFLTPIGVVHADSSGEWKSGKEAYEKVCAYCHEKGVGPAIKGRGAPPEYWAVVRYGRRAMPPFRSTEMSDEVLTQVMDYIK